MVTNAVTIPGESFLNISGSTLHIKPLHRAGFLTVMVPGGLDEGAYTPAQSSVIYIRNAEQARLIAQAFTELAEAIQK